MQRNATVRSWALACWSRLAPSALLLYALLLSSVMLRAAATCYDYDGKEMKDVFPCDATADVSQCCSKNDFCLSNGLCLDAGSNNGFTQQGCTSKGWDFPCQKYCRDNAGMAEGGAVYFAQCSGFDARDENALCCGTDYTCCNSTSDIITTIPKFTTLSRPAGAPQTASGTATSASASTTPPPSKSTGAKPSSSSSDRSVVIGASVGATLGVALLAALGMLAWQMRKQKAFKSTSQSQSTAAGTGYMSVQQKQYYASELQAPPAPSELPSR